jgi:glycerol-3-phosphate acyltransferase PlsY
MSETFMWLIGGAVAYLVGSVPFGFLLAKSRGKDIRTLGSGNIGATNVFRAVSKPLGILTFALDMAKGYCGVKLIPLLAARLAGGSCASMVLPLFCGAMTVAGHNWSCFLGFKGGKGIATSAGMLLALSPVGVGIAFVVWLAVFLATRYVSAASITAAVALGAATWPLYYTRHGVWFCGALTMLAALAVWKHRSNIARLRAGTESRFNFVKKKDQQTS